MSFSQRFALVLFAAFFLASIATSLMTFLCSGAIVRAANRGTAAARASKLAFFRLLPGLCALAMTAFVLAPGYYRHEQRGELEGVGLALLISAGGGLLIVAASIRRGVRAWLATAALRRDWLAAGRPLPEGLAGMPAFEIDTPFPLVAVLGVMRPRLFISKSVLLGCTRGELDAIVEHERRHVSALDNMTRLLMDAAPDALGRTRLARVLASAWHQAVEHRADDAAAHRLDLASALVRVARMAGGAPPVLLASALYRGESIEGRVRRLVAGPRESAPRASRSLLAAAASLAVALGAAAASSRVSDVAHGLLETFVSLP